MTESKSVALPLGDAPSWRRDRSPGRSRKAGTVIQQIAVRPRPTIRPGESSRQRPRPPPRRGTSRSRWPPNRSSAPIDSQGSPPAPPAHRRSRASAALRVVRSAAARDSALRHPPSGNRAGSENPPVRARKTAGVETAIPGLTSTIPISGNAGAGVRISPIPAISAGEPATHTGTSAPRPPASWPNTPESRFQNRHSSRSAAAASADPPPMPDATGKFFSSTSAPVACRPARAAKVCAAFKTRLSGSPASPAANGPVTDNVNRSAVDTVSRSPIPANTTRLSSR
jgi:hypothetical protein